MTVNVLDSVKFYVNADVILVFFQLYTVAKVTYIDKVRPTVIMYDSLL